MPAKDEFAWDNSAFLPKARTLDLVIQKTGKDILVYDTQKRKAHHLNETTSDVWKQCDGTKTISEIAIILSEEKGETIESDFVVLALFELDKAELLEDKLPENGFGQFSRRKVLLRYAVPALAFPIVTSLVTPTPAQTGSCLGSGQTDCCVTPCCPGLSCQVALGISCPGVCVPII